MKYDDASWHYGGKFPKDLPVEAAATHTGMFLVWALKSGLAGNFHLEESTDEIANLQTRTITPGAFFLKVCDGKFTDEDLNDEGNAFTKAYFDFDTGRYLVDYGRTVGANLPELYYVKDTWENFDLLKPILDLRLTEWRAQER